MTSTRKAAAPVGYVKRHLRAYHAWLRARPDSQGFPPSFSPGWCGKVPPPQIVDRATASKWRFGAVDSVSE